MLKLSDRAHPAWVRNPNPSVGHLRLHWLATHCVADQRPGVGEPQPDERVVEPFTMTPAAAKPAPSDSRRSGSAVTPSVARRQARIIAMAAGRCADCGQPATGVRTAGEGRGDVNASSVRPVCDHCRTQRRGSPMADVMAGVMAQYAATARSA